MGFWSRTAPCMEHVGGIKVVIEHEDGVKLLPFCQGIRCHHWVGMSRWLLVSPAAQTFRYLPEHLFRMKRLFKQGEVISRLARKREILMCRVTGEEQNIAIRQV